VHNGWCYVHPPHILYLERDFPKASQHMSGSINRQMLVLRGSLELTELVDNPHYVIIMELEYLVNWGSAEVNMCTGSLVTYLSLCTGMIQQRCLASLRCVLHSIEDSDTLYPAMYSLFRRTFQI